MKAGNTYEIRLSGTGGQGLVLIGIILGEAAAIYDGKNAVQTQSYGPEARGGASRSDVIISGQAIDYFLVSRPDILLAMSQEAYDRFIADTHEGSLVLVDSTWVKKMPPTGLKTYGLPLTQIARDVTGKAIAANMVGLGALVSLTRVVSREAVEKAISGNVDEKNRSMNLRALHEGWKSAQNLK